MPEYRKLAERFGRAGIEVGSSSTPDEVARAVTTSGMHLIEPAMCAGITWGHNGRYQTLGATGELASHVEKIQYELGSGPCVDAATDDSIFCTGDLRREQRWPEFAARAVLETAVLSLLSVRMFFEDDDVVASLNFYSTEADAFDEQAEMCALILATHATLALASANRQEKIENLQRALTSNRDIGVAMGILMVRHLVTRQQAFDLLRVVSQHTHRKLADVAQDVVESGELEYPTPRARRGASSA